MTDQTPTTAPRTRTVYVQAAIATTADAAVAWAEWKIDPTYESIVDVTVDRNGAEWIVDFTIEPAA